MNQNVTQWLAEIQSLQRQVSELQKEREQAYASADNWRKLYESEAGQRRRESENGDRQIKRLQQVVAELQTPATELIEGEDAKFSEEISAIQSIQSVEQLQSQLVAAKRLCARLKGELKAEQEAHEKTRESLTAALGDTVDLLARERLSTAPGEG